MVNRALVPLISALLLGACPGSDAGSSGPGGKADSFGECIGESGAVLCECDASGCSEQRIEVLLTEPFCDVCAPADKDVLLARSPIIARAVELIDGAETSIDVAQFTFSRRQISDALIRAHERGVTVRIAMDSGQDRDGSLARKLRDDADLDLRFVGGKQAGGGFPGIQHSKFMVVDGETLLTGSNNWSSTGTSINEENTIVVTAPEDDDLITGFRCHFEAIWAEEPDSSVGCSNDSVKFTPGSPAKNHIRDAIRASTRSVDVLMHHFTFDDLVKELAKAQERGVQVRVIINAADRDEHAGSSWDRLLAAGGQIHLKKHNEDAFQLMHHKLAIVDDRILINGSGNWSGSAFFNNFENYVTYRQPAVVREFVDLYDRLWTWSLSPENFDAGVAADQQHAEETDIYFGNLHAHISAEDGERILDDGKALRLAEDGTEIEVRIEKTVADASRFAFEYARDVAKLDFLAISPHVVDDRDSDSPTMANMHEDGYRELLEMARQVSLDSAGSFAAIPSMEWSTNSTGNHVGILGSTGLAKTERGRFDLLYDEFLPGRAAFGDRPLLMLNHPRTFRVHDSLEGNWDQIFEVNLADIPNNSDRNKKFNDFGLDDYSPLRELRESWISGAVMPDEAVVRETLDNVQRAAAPYARLMEVTVSRGTQFGSETAQNPSLSVDDSGVESRFEKVHRDFDYYLSRGFKLAPVASHDNHFANWGTGHSSRTGVVGRELTPEAILTAVHRRAVFASEDENLEVRFYADGRVPMGSEHATLDSEVTGRVLIVDSDYQGPYELRLFGAAPGGEVALVETRALAEDGWVDLALDVSGAGDHVFYVEVHEIETERMAWSAPIWIEKL